MKPKETLFSISQKYDVSLDKIYSSNKFLKNNTLQIGDILNIPNIPKAPIPEGFDKYIVKKKEGLWRISKILV